MSYILDALRRADSERERGAVPGLHAQAIPLSAEEPPVLPGTAGGAPAGRWAALGLGAGLLIALGAWWLSASGEADGPAPAAPPLPAPPAAAPRAEPTLAIPAPAPLVAPAAAPAAPTPARAAARPPAASPRPVAELGGGADDVPGAAPSRAAERMVPPARSAPPEPSRPPRGSDGASLGAAGAGTPPGLPTTVAPAPQGVPGVPMAGAARPWNGPGAPAGLPGAAPATTPHGVPPPPAGAAGTGTAALATPPGAAPATAASAAGRIYAPNDLPEEIRRQLPGLSIGGSVYSESPASRFLILNGQVRHEGDQAAPEVTLEKIKLRSAVLNFRGYRFELGY